MSRMRWVCGVARRHFEDPPLDIPRRPAWSEVGAAYAAAAYGVLAFGGAVVLLSPSLLAAIGVAREWVWLEVALATAAAYGSTLEALFVRRFNQATLEVPRSVRTGTRFVAALTLVPYERLERVWVTLELVDRFYETVHRDGRRSVRTRSRVVERVRLQAGEALPGRRQHRFEAEFDAPIPTTAHSNVQAEITASIAAFFAPLVPGLAHFARNLRAHGGYYVRASVRMGPWRRSFEEQVVSVAVPSSLTGGVATGVRQAPSAGSAGVREPGVQP
jgi:hypothetical protein